MGIKMNDMQIGIFCRHSTDSAERYEMFAANHQRNFIAVDDFLRELFNIFKRIFHTAERQFQIAAVKNESVFQIKVKIRAVRLKSVAFRAHGAAGKACAGTIRRSGVKRRSE